MQHKLILVTFLLTIGVLSSQNTFAAFVIKCDRDTVVVQKDVTEQTEKTKNDTYYVKDYKQRKGGALGILAIVFAATLLGPLAIIFGAIGVRHNCHYKTLARIGFWVGIFETVLFTILFIWILSTPFMLDIQFRGPLMSGLV